MDASALDNAISALEKSISIVESQVDSLEFWLWVSTTVVVIGVALELCFIVREHHSQREAWRRASIRSPEKPSAWFFILEMASVLLVVLGIAGELVVGVFSANKNAELRNKNGLLVALVREKASNAEKEAGQARKEAEALRQSNLLLQSEILKVQERMADRHLSAAQRARIIPALLKFARETANLMPRLDKPEAVGFSRELLGLLTKDALWDVKETGGLMGRENPEDRGIVVDVSREGAPRRAQALVDTLNAVGIKARLNRRSGAFPVDGVLIIVGSKP
jgi:hypothetical protein